MKSLKIIQILAKIIKIVCTVLTIIFIVGASICALSIILLPILKDTVIYEGKSFSIIIAENGTNYITALVASIVAFISCGAGIFLAKYTESFFKKELELGTPFNKELVKDMRKMAVVHIVLSIVVLIIISILIAIFESIYPEIIDIEYRFSGTIGFGLAMLVISLFCDYGAETKQEDNNEVL